MKRKAFLFLTATFAAAVFSPTLTRAGDSTSGELSVQKTLPISGEGRWDYATFDTDSHRLYVTRSTHTQAIDVSDGKVVADITGQKRAHGTAIVSSAGRGFITDGQNASIVIFDLKSGLVLGSATAAD